MSAPGLPLFLIKAGLVFGLFLLCSLHLQLALGRGPLSTGLTSFRWRSLPESAPTSQRHR